MSNVMIGSGDPARTEALARAVRSRGELQVETASSSHEAALAGFDAATAVIVIDELPAAGTLRVIADATEARPELAVLVTGPAAPPTEAMVALASGALGYLPDGSDPEVVAAAVDDLVVGEPVLPRVVAAPLVRHLRWSGRGIVVDDEDGRAIELTNREWEVLVLLRQARTTTEIARRLVVSNGTVRTHVSAVLRKLGIPDRASLLTRSRPD